MNRIKKLFILLLCSSMLTSNAVTVRAATNLAYGKTTFASSMYDEAGNYSPDKVTDGDYNNIWSMGSITLEGARGGVDQYIAVDLGEAYMLDAIVAASRRGLDNAEARTGWYVQVANDEYFTDAVTIRAGYNTVSYEGDYKFICDLGAPYRYVRVCSPAYFTVAEIEVYGEKYDPTTMNRKVVFSDTKDKFYQPGAMLLSSLGIMNGISNTEFAGERILTRAQAARIITAFAQIDIEEAKGQVFADVAEDHWAADYIYTATKSDIISADEYFRPEDYVTDKEFLKLVLYAMGYGEYVELCGGWEKGVYEVSNLLDLTKRAGVSKLQNLSRGSAAMILYNALNSPLPKAILYSDDGGRYIDSSGETMLEANFGLTIVKGKMTENSTTSLIRPTGNGTGRIRIDNDYYYEPDQIMEFWLGKNVGVAVDVDSKTVVHAAWLDSTYNDSVTVYDFQRLDADTGYYTYETETGKTKRLKLSDKMFLVKNNSGIVDWTKDDLICPDGHIEFTDNDDDGVYDVALCFEPQVMLVSHVSNDNGKVNVLSIDGTKVHGENLSYLNITKNGKNTTAGRIAKYDVAKVYQSLCGKSLWIDVGGESITAEAGSVYSDEAELDGDLYRFTEYYKNNSSRAVALSPGKMLRFLLDNMGRIVWVMEDDTIESTETIGYIVKMSNVNEYGDEPIKFKIYTQQGTFSTYYTAEKVVVDGVRYKIDVLRDRIQNGLTDILGEFVMFRLNDEGLLSFLDTEEIGRETDSKIVPITDRAGNKLSFVAHSGQFGNIHNYPAGEGIYEDTYLQQPLRRDTLAFIIPVNEDGEPLDKGYEGFYRVSTAEHTWTTLNPISERTEFYGPDDDNYPAFGVRYKTYITGSQEGISAVDDNDAVGMVVTRVKNAVNDDLEIIKEIRGYNIANGRETLIKTNLNITRFIETGRIQQEHSDWLADGTKYLSLPTLDDVTEAQQQAEEFETYCKDIQNIKKGDVILYQIDGNYVTSLERVFSIEDVDYSTYVSNKGSYYTSGSRGSYPDTMGASFKLMYGKVRGLSNGIMKYQNVPQEDTAGKYPMQIAYDKMSSIFVVEGGKVSVDSASNLPAYISVGDEIVVHSSTGKFLSAIIYK